jgi:DNA (cytosine-5)-methyltransferase 1
MENVQGLLFRDALPELEEAVGALPANYGVLGPLVLDAADFGAPTSRKRVFVIGWDTDRCSSISDDDLTSRHAPSRTVFDAFSGLSSAQEADSEDEFDRWRIPDETSLSDYARSLVSADRTFSGNMRTKHTIEVRKRFSTIAPGSIDKVGRHPRLEWNGVAPTIRAGTGADRGSHQSLRPIHPGEHRVITVREAARLQGFPDDHLFHPTIWHSFRMIGNSVSPIIAAAVLGAVAERLAVEEETKEAA